MNKQIYEVDSDGFISEIYLGEFDEVDNLINPVGEYVTMDLPQPLYFYKPKWNGSEWIEGESKEERDEREGQQLLESLSPSQEELAKAAHRLDTIELLLEMGLV